MNFRHFFSADGSYLTTQRKFNSSGGLFSDLFTCLNAPIMSIQRNFQFPDGQNKISFEYKVDGMECRSGSSCVRGFRVLINGKVQLYAATQFHWTKFEMVLDKVLHVFNSFDMGFFLARNLCTPIVEDVHFSRHLSYSKDFFLEKNALTPQKWFILRYPE